MIYGTKAFNLTWCITKNAPQPRPLESNQEYTGTSLDPSSARVSRGPRWQPPKPLVLDRTWGSLRLPVVKSSMKIHFYSKLYSSLLQHSHEHIYDWLFILPSTPSPYDTIVLYTVSSHCLHFPLQQFLVLLLEAVMGPHASCLVFLSLST